MILERAELLVKPGTGDEFSAILKERGVALLSSGKGCLSVKVGRGVEDPDKFILLLEWDTVASHVAYVESPDHHAFSALFGPFAAGGAMEHFNIF